MRRVLYMHNTCATIILAIFFIAALLVVGIIVSVAGSAVLVVLKAMELGYGWTSRNYRELKYRMYPSLRHLKRHEFRYRR